MAHDRVSELTDVRGIFTAHAKEEKNTSLAKQSGPDNTSW